jgi:23S rRNA (adenine2503-C2)-methyltransferase
MGSGAEATPQGGSAGRRNLLGMTLEELRAFVASLGERSFRGDQIYRWLYTRGAISFDAMTDIARASREVLSRTAVLAGVVPVTSTLSPADGTTKFLFGLTDGLHVESVLIPPSAQFDPDEDRVDDSTRRERLTLCVSTQVGCPLACAFCATGTMGFLRNLTVAEIVGQVLHVRRVTGQRITNVVFMGMGEPLLNYERVMQAVEIMTDGMDIGAKRITVSTAGWADGILRMASERRRIKLAVSLHSASEEVRKQLMPITRRFPLDRLLDAVRRYYAETRIRVTYEVIFFDGVNDRPDDIRRLITFVRAVPSKVNVIPYHSIAFAHPEGFGASLRPSPRVTETIEQLRAANITVMVRSSAGEDIAAACGQLAVAAPRRRRQGGAIPRTRTTLPLETTNDNTPPLWTSRRGEGNAGETSR